MARPRGRPKKAPKIPEDIDPVETVVDGPLSAPPQKRKKASKTTDFIPEFQGEEDSFRQDWFPDYESYEEPELIRGISRDILLDDDDDKY